MMLSILIGLLFLTCHQILAEGLFYPEVRSDLQQYQDTSKCYPDVGEWYQMYRNYYSDPHFGGTAKCVKYSMVGQYENFSSRAIFTFTGERPITGQLNLGSADCYETKDTMSLIPDDKNLTQVTYYVIYTDCMTCCVFRHRYAAGGYGCTYWRRADMLDKPDDCCQFIYDEHCGSSPKYPIYDFSCSD